MSGHEDDDQGWGEGERRGPDNERAGRADERWIRGDQSGESDHRDPDAAPADSEPERWGVDGERWSPDEDVDDFEEAPSPRWPLDWRGLYPRERWLWFEQLWTDVCMLRGRYRLAIRSGWWEDEVQVEALAALSAWVDRYDSGEWDDPPGKLGLLFDLERVAGLLRDGMEPFHPDRDRAAFARYLVDIGCHPPPGGHRGR